VGRVLPAAVGHRPGLRRWARAGRLRHGLGPHAARGLARAPRQPAVGAPPGQRPRRGATLHGAVLPACRGRDGGAPRHLEGCPARGRVVASAPGAPARGRRRDRRRFVVDALVELYAYLYGCPPDEVRRAAELRVDAMDVSDRWVEEGCHLASPMLAEERSLLVRSSRPCCSRFTARYRLVRCTPRGPTSGSPTVPGDGLDAATPGTSPRDPSPAPRDIDAGYLLACCVVERRLHGYVNFTRPRSGRPPPRAGRPRSLPTDGGSHEHTDRAPEAHPWLSRIRGTRKKYPRKRMP
jgi:hypothetical protein